MNTLRALALTATVCFAADPSLSGEWKIQRSAAGRDSTQTCNFVQKDAELTGTCTAQNGEVKVAGKLVGRKVTWTYRSESEGGAVTVVYAGTVDSADEMSGSVIAVEFAIEGTFQATRVK